MTDGPNATDAEVRKGESRNFSRCFPGNFQSFPEQGLARPKTPWIRDSG